MHLINQWIHYFKSSSPNEPANPGMARKQWPEPRSRRYNKKPGSEPRDRYLNWYKCKLAGPFRGILVTSVCKHACRLHRGFRDNPSLIESTSRPKTITGINVHVYALKYVSGAQLEIKGNPHYKHRAKLYWSIKRKEIFCPCSFLGLKFFGIGIKYFQEVVQILIIRLQRLRIAWWTPIKGVPLDR